MLLKHFLEHFRNVSGMLLKRFWSVCWSISGMLLEHFRGIPESLQKRFWNVVETFLEHLRMFLERFGSIAGMLPKCF